MRGRKRGPAAEGQRNVFKNGKSGTKAPRPKEKSKFQRVVPRRKRAIPPLEKLWRVKRERDRRACCCVGENCAEEIEDETKREGDSTSEMNLSQAMAKSSNFSSAATLFLKLYC